MSSLVGDFNNRNKVLTAKLLRQGYRYHKIRKNDFSYHFKKIIVRYKKMGYNIDVLRQTACLLFIQSRLTALLTSLIARR